MAAFKVLTVAIIGCCSIEAAIASGILDASSVDGNIPETEGPIRISHVIATVETDASRQRVLSSLSRHSQKVDIRLKSENTAALQEADVILFSIKSIKRGEILTEPAAREALRGKLLISVMGGINTSVLHTAINGDGAPSDSECQIVRVMPNLAAQIRQAVSLGTFIPGRVTPENSKITEWISSQVGDFQFIPETHFDIASILSRKDLKRSEAQPLLVKSIIGLLGLLTTGGGHPSVTREKISSPGGNSIQALLELEGRGVRSAFTAAITKASERSRNSSK
ncbi:hypothetical protein BKA61DRAFT_627127 [Leptodontidium sp. MPI-SDFR-AT-0119]|nr:hypothetical protein BKA61DRAFT_627127 [Leptodontidium sp. MPI-SDFR-AT-0119]